MSRASIAAFAVAVLVLFGGTLVATQRDRPDRKLARREAAWGLQLQTGDVVLQQLECGLRCALIRDVTHSRYTHVGVVQREPTGERFVWEAFGDVERVPLDQWLDRGKDGKVAIYRPRTVDAAALVGQLASFRGRPFDAALQWDDEHLYAAELVAKAFARAGTPLVEPHPLGPGAFKGHEQGVRGLTEGRLTESTPVVMPIDFTRSPALEKRVDELSAPLDDEGSSS